MSDLSFGIHIFASTIAISAAYAILMSVLKREVNGVWLKGEALTALIASGTALGFGSSLLFDGDTVAMLSALMLLLGLGNALGLVIVQRLRATGSEYPPTVAALTRTLGIIMFVSFVTSFLIELAALSRV